MGTATFMILGSTCTRACKFCAVKSSGKGEPLDFTEPNKIASTAKNLGLDYVVLTSVTRDDLEDGGAGHFAKCIQSLKREGFKAEALIPDFGGRSEALMEVVNAKPDVLAHNLETVRELQKELRNEKASYERSLGVLKNAKKISPQLLTKSSLMLGVGETREQVLETMRDLKEAGVEVLVLGQYLSPSRKHYPVKRYVHPLEFAELKRMGGRIGFQRVVSGPFVRSSFNAGLIYAQIVGGS